MIRALFASLVIFLPNCVGLTPNTDTADPTTLVPAACNVALSEDGPALWRAPPRVVVAPSQIRASGFDAAGYPLATPDRALLHGWLVDGNTKALEAAYNAIRLAARNDLRLELWLFDAFEVFDEPDDEITSGITDWVAAQPNSIAAQEAEALHSEAIGWARRGGKFSNETSEEQFAGMRSAFARAKVLATRILDRDPGSLIATKILIRMAKASRGSSLEQTEALIAAASASNSRFLREIQLLGLARRWGGSPEEMSFVLETAISHFETHPELRGLCGYIAWDSAKSKSKEEWKAAQGQFELARRYGDLPLFAVSASDSYRRAGDPTRALAIDETGLSAQPQYRDLILRRAWNALGTDRIEDALDSCQTLSQMNPRSQKAIGCWKTGADHYGRQGNEAYHGQQLRAAVKAYTKSFRFHADHENLIYWRGRSYDRLGQIDAAVADYRTAIQREPNRLEIYGMLAGMLNEAGRIHEMIPLAEQYVELNPGDLEGLAHRGTVRLFAGDTKRALEDLRYACNHGSAHGCNSLKSVPGG